MAKQPCSPLSQECASSHVARHDRSTLHQSTTTTQDSLPCLQSTCTSAAGSCSISTSNIWQCLTHQTQILSDPAGPETPQAQAVTTIQLEFQPFSGPGGAQKISLSYWLG